ncbi:MAG: type II toxin-antitoxin system HicA family toxin [bacterium]|nr:type II toxin-antitoxin system HicA family toxin [bacterium]
MPPFGPIKRKDLIIYLKQCDFDGPFAGGKHQFMTRNDLTIHIPNPHQADIGRDLLTRILRQAHIEKSVWEEL